MPSRREEGGWHKIAPDRGCRLHHACLTCPFPRCVHDGPGGSGVGNFVEAQALAGRNAQIREAHQMRAPLDEIGAAFGVSRRQTQRILQA